MTLVLRAKDGHELARGSGAAPIFQKAVRLAMDPILGSALVPRAPESDVAWQAWHRARTAEAAVALVDYAAACSSENRAALAEECERVLARSDLHDDMLTFLRLDCTERQRENLPSIALPKIDHAAAPDLLMDVMLRRFTSDGAQSRAFALELQKALDAEPVRERRALLFAAQAMCFANAGEMRSAHESALAAVHADPKSIDARMFGWHALSFYSPNVMVGPAHSSWVPWEPLAQYATAEGGDTDMRIRAAKRATEVGPRGFWPQALGDLLLRAGKREDARNVAVQSNNDVLRMEILMSEAAFGNALAHAKKIIDEAPATRDGSDRAAGVALYASYAASILGRDADVVEPLVKRYVDAEPPIMSGRVVAFVSLVLACAQAPEPTAKRCVSRLRSLHAKGQLGAAFGGVDMLLAGAERFAARDYAGAAKTWRSATRSGGWMVDQLREPLATALDKSGDAELGESLDALVTATPGLCNGADLAFVRSARRAEKRGDKERAKRLARAIVEAWSVADETVPAVAEMKKMLERLK